ncbi:MAG: YceI family protein [Gemmatimonadetes bacterium]|nr:YceI family protein [Gemmatimonadota bacterium]
MARRSILSFAKRTVRMVALFVPAFLVASRAHAQATNRFTVDERSSLAWWQMSPHLDHLWATTCPQDPNWQPGSERSSGWAYDPSKAPKTGHSNIIDTVHVPLYPRPAGQAQAICPAAVRGEIAVADTSSWRGVKGLISIRSDAFITGLNMRDEYARKAVLQSQSYPDIRFHLDSLADVRRGDTITANAVGQFELRGVSQPMVVPIKAWKEGSGMRVTGKFTIRPAELVEKYRVSQLALGLGVGTGIWHYLHLGFDVVLRSGVPGQASASQPTR